MARVQPNGASYADQPGTGVPPGPLRLFSDRLDEIRSAEILDLDQVGRVLAELAADEEFLGPPIAQLPADSPGSRWLIRPARGPRLVWSTVQKESWVTPTRTTAGWPSPRSEGGDPPAVGCGPLVQIAIGVARHC